MLKLLAKYFWWWMNVKSFLLQQFGAFLDVKLEIPLSLLLLHCKAILHCFNGNSNCITLTWACLGWGFCYRIECVLGGRRPRTAWWCCIHPAFHFFALQSSWPLEVPGRAITLINSASFLLVRVHLPSAERIHRNNQYALQSDSPEIQNAWTFNKQQKDLWSRERSYVWSQFILIVNTPMWINRYRKGQIHSFLWKFK